MLMLKIAKDLFDLLYPIGTYYETSNANWTPSNAGWYGTWTREDDGRVLVSFDNTQTEFNSIGKTGGSKYLQEHSHLLKFNGGYDSDYSSPFAVNKYIIQGDWYNIYTEGWVQNAGTGDSGNLQPYKVAYRWHRTA